MSRDHREPAHPLGDLFVRTSRLLYEENPIGIHGGPDDEYDPEVGTILPRLEGATSAQDVQVIVHEEFCRWFSEDIAGDYGKYESVSQSIWSLWCAYERERDAHTRAIKARNNVI